MPASSTAEPYPDGRPLAAAARPLPGRLALLGWAAVAVAAASWLSLVEVFWLPLRVDGVLFPVSVLAAVGGNLVLPELARQLTRSRAVAVLPAVVWLVVAFSASTRRAEGDLLLVGGGAPGVVNLAFLLAGAVAAAFSAGRALARRRQPPPAPEAGRP